MYILQFSSITTLLNTLLHIVIVSVLCITLVELLVFFTISVYGLFIYITVFFLYL